jgi:hypothetical protein
MKSEKGQSLVEFALVLPILVVVLFGIVDFGRIFHAYITVDHAGREAARAASVGKTQSQAQSIAVSSAAGIDLTKTGASVTVSPAPPSASDPYPSGTDVQIQIIYPFEFVTPLIGNFFINSFTIDDTTVMRVE